MSYLIIIYYFNLNATLRVYSIYIDIYEKNFHIKCTKKGEKKIHGILALEAN